MRDDGHIPGYRVVIVTLDAHAAGPAKRVTERLAADFPGLSVTVHAAAEWSECPKALEAAKDAVRYANERELCGRPIGKFQVIRHKLAEMATGLDVCRTYVYALASPWTGFTNFSFSTGSNTIPVPNQGLGAAASPASRAGRSGPAVRRAG